LPTDPEVGKLIRNNPRKFKRYRRSWSDNPGSLRIEVRPEQGLTRLDFRGCDDMSLAVRSSGLACLSLALLVGAPGRVAAGSLGYQNMTNLVVMVQGSSTDAKGNEHKGPPHEINPKETAFDQINAAGPKKITIYDPKKANVIYYQGTINFTGKDQLYSIQFDNAGAAGAAPKVKLVPVPIPQAMPAPKKKKM
jgi:hypothetical protein